jgi:hypothetical protein
MIGDNEAETVELFGRAMVSASDVNLAFLRELCDGKDTMSRDEFSIWLLHLLGRIDSSDIKVVRHVYGIFGKRESLQNNFEMEITYVEKYY